MKFNLENLIIFLLTSTIISGMLINVGLSTTYIVIVCFILSLIWRVYE